MKYLKNICIILCLVGITQYASGQVYKFQTTGFTVSEKNEKGVWGKWSDFQKASLVVTLDTNKNRIIIYSQEIQLYEIVNYEEKQDNENDEIFHFSCRNDDGEPFLISIITRKKQGNRKQLYINHKDAIIAYTIINLK